MCWVFRSYAALFFACIGLASHAAVPPDSLTIKDKAFINTMAASLFHRYVDMLSAIASADAGDEEASMLMQGLLEAACAPGPDRLFIGTDAQIEDNVDPSAGPGSLSKDRRVGEYANDLLLFFNSDNAKGNPVQARLLKKREPARSEKVFTQVLYDIRFLGKHRSIQSPYRNNLRVLDLVADRDAGGTWRVLISADSWFDTTAVFPEYTLERDLASALSTRADTSALTAEQKQYRNSAEAVRMNEERERADRKKAYTHAIAAGKDYQAKGDLDNAITLFEEAKTRDPLAIEPIILLSECRRAKKVREERDRKTFDDLVKKGRALRSMREHERALSAFEQAAQVFPNDPALRATIDTVNAALRAKADREKHYISGSYDRSLTEAQDALKVGGPDALEHQLVRAKSLIALKRSPEAVKELTTIITREPFFAEALTLRAGLNEKSTDPAAQRAAAEDYYTLMNHDQWNMLPYHRLAVIRCEAQKLCKEAVNILGNALQREPMNAQTLYLLGRLHGFGKLDDFAISASYLRTAIAADSTCSKCWLELGISLNELDSVASAEAAVKKARALGLSEEQLERAKSLGANSIERAEALRKVNAYGDADRLFRRACVLNPNEPAYRLMKARNLMAIKHWEEAIVDLDQHIASTPAPYAAMLDRATCALELGQHVKALADVEVIQRNNVAALATRADLIAGQAHYALGDLGKSESFLKEALKKDDRNPIALFLMGRISLAHSRYNEAKTYAKRAVDADEQNPATHFNLGLVQQGMKDQSGSIASFEKALALGADRVDVYKQMGRSCMITAAYKQALEHFRSQQLLRDDPQTRRWMAECFFNLQDHAAALGELNALRAAHPDVEREADFLAEISYLFTLNDLPAMAKEFLEKAEAADNTYKRTMLSRAAYLQKTNEAQPAVDLLFDMVQRGLVSEKEVKAMPVLKEIAAGKLWAAKKK